MQGEDLTQLSRPELEARFMRTLIAYHSEKWEPTGFYRSMPDRVEQVATQLSELNKQLAASSAAQTKLATALNVFTFLLVIVGAVQIFLRM